jgi:hypothetical protein
LFGIFGSGGEMVEKTRKQDVVNLDLYCWKRIWCCEWGEIIKIALHLGIRQALLLCGAWKHSKIRKCPYRKKT